MSYLKAGVIGLLGSLVIFMVMMITINKLGVAPFHVPPSAAFLISQGLPAKPLAIILHFVYGFAWASIAYAIFKDKLSIGKATLLSVGVQWLLLMQLIISPMIGWGVFGSNAGAAVSNQALELSSMPKYIVMTLILHIVYGAINGWLIPKWLNKPEAPANV